MIRLDNESGFTFVEVLVAMAIFVMAVVASVSLTGGSVRATKEAKDISTAAWLLQSIMVQLETRLETEGFDKGCEKMKEAKFDPPYDRYTWATYCYQIDFNLSQTAAQLAQKEAKGDNDTNDQATEDMIMKAVLQTANTYLANSIRELHVEVMWTQGKQKRKVDATTHVARYDQQLTVGPVVK